MYTHVSYIGIYLKEKKFKQKRSIFFHSIRFLFYTQIFYKIV